LQEIKVALGARSYSILVASGLLDRLGDNIPVTGKKALVTTPVVQELYGERIAVSLGDHTLILVPDGEEAKQWSIVEELLGKFMDAGMDRKSTVIALGGGTVGDLAGFAASIYLRGIDVVQIPTTLLAMVDSSIGGKTAVNHPRGKNLVGSFYQPSKVLIDPIFLGSLPERELRSGMAEVIKYGVISDSELFNLLESKNLSELSTEDLVEIIARCADTKARYVEQDEEDRLGIRAALNYGHTVGHAVETLTDHMINHGEGVAIGMAVAAWIALENGLITGNESARIHDIIKKYGLPSRLPRLDHSKILDVMHRDKKAEEGRIRFVLPTGIGKPPELQYIEDGAIKRALEEYS
jgi:3-dehydroquinate synthase